MKKIITIILISQVSFSFAQIGINEVLKGGEIIVSGLTFLKSSKSDSNNSKSKFISSVCVKNKLAEKITLNLKGKNEDDEEIFKEMIIQNDGKECVFEIPKGIYTYEILLSNNEVYKKGEYKFDDDIVITVKE